ncbi:hypothetical protein NSK_004391 [Nannochloropsis salina CCMP1776]|uniref:peptidylprolyl isomerase n=1 Tax=Nannochloropsis salina CCMP1776 TaxID=1027361 RepID=A0A4D9CZE6_9STRA|nr:hypothetical protein NSK_004391 [Nannochloropsis salina CCMP1776]|eukprot:TFJ84406.1 hypothetical protein NSK_004391 [Nannochloropsis salina CCMP1776]
MGASRLLHLCSNLLLLVVTTAYVVPSMTTTPTSWARYAKEKGVAARREAVGFTGMLGAVALAMAGSTATTLAWPLQVLAEESPVKVRKVNPNKIRETPNGVKYVDVKVGEGESPRGGDYVIITYIGQLSDGTIFDGLHGPGKKPLAFKIGAKQVIPGLEEALLSMQAGGERQLLVPADLAFGEKGVCTEKGECLVPPNTNVKYNVILKRVAVSPI